jgi:uncharacterized protein involved in tolerance to divalent cations
MILAYIISNSSEEAEYIAMDLLKKKLVYSVNIVPDVKSYRRQEDDIIRQKRTIVLCKTKSSLYEKIEVEVLRVQTTGTAIVFSMPMTQLSQNLFDNIRAFASDT